MLSGRALTPGNSSGEVGAGPTSTVASGGTEMEVVTGEADVTLEISVDVTRDSVVVAKEG